MLFGHRPYTLFKNGVQASTGLTDAQGFVTIDKADLKAQYAVELSNGSRFELPVQEQFAAADTLQGQEQRLSNQGLRADGQATQARIAQHLRGQRDTPPAETP